MFVVGYGTNVSTPFLVLYKERLGLGPSATVSIFVVYVLGILATLLVIGPLSDRFGRRPIVVPYTVLAGLASLVLIPGRNSFLLLLLGRLMLGMVSGAVLAIGAAWMQEIVGKGEEMRAAIIATVVGYLGFGAGPVVSAFFEWIDAAPLVWPFVLHAAMSFVIVGFVLRVPETHARPDPPPPFRLNFGIPPASRTSFLRLVVPATLWVFGFPSTGFALFPVLISDALSGAEVTVAAASAAITAWSGASARPTMNRLGAQRSLPIAMATGTAGYILGTIAFATDIWGLVLPAAFCLGAASGLITAACLTLIGEMADDDSRGALAGTFYLIAYPGMAMPLIITSVGAAVGSTSAALLFVTFAATLSTGAIWMAVRNQAAATA